MKIKKKIEIKSCKIKVKYICPQQEQSRWFSKNLETTFLLCTKTDILQKQITAVYIKKQKNGHDKGYEIKFDIEK